MLQFSRGTRFAVIAIALFGLLYALPSVLAPVLPAGGASWPSWAPGRQVNLGLDLQGGCHLLFEADTSAFRRERLDQIENQLRDRFRESRIRYRGLDIADGGVVATLPDPEQHEAVAALLEELGEEVTTGFTDGALNVRLEEGAFAFSVDTAMQQAVEILRRRVDAMGTTEPLIQRQGERRILVQLPGAASCDVPTEAGRLSFHLVDQQATPEQIANRTPPPGTMLVEDVEQPGVFYPLRRAAMVTGDMLTGANPTLQDGLPAVGFRLNTAGSRQFCKVTTENVGELFAIVLDGKTISAPRIQGQICGGQGVISGNFTTASAAELALLLRSGALSIDLDVKEKRTVGPTLGADSVRAGLLAGIIGFVLVALFMALVYSLFGLFAAIALVVNLALIIALLAILGATLTLPGIAGIVLTIGMAVDANVLIFERIREELRLGRTPISAIDAGYSRAMTTIIDSNLTTLIAAAMLYAFGSGPVRGFAVTLTIGIVTSMFSAIMLTRLLVWHWLRRTRGRGGVPV